MKVEQMMALQSTPIEIVRAVVKEFGCSDRLVYSDIDAVLESLAAIDFGNKRARKARMRMSWQVLYRQAMADKAWHTAAVVLDRLCRLDGLYEQLDVAPPPPGSGIVAVVQQVVGMSPIERQREMARLLEKRQRLGIDDTNPPGSAPGPQKVLDIREADGADDGDHGEEEDEPTE